MDKLFKTPRQAALIARLKEDLGDLDRELIHLDGKMMKPSQCYRIELDPVHVLYNTNCPDTLKEKIQSILGKYLETDEGRSQPYE